MFLTCLLGTTLFCGQEWGSGAGLASPVLGGH
ncbi:unnamed protein product [Linum tenue]|nr:unnamed protein product [Linum tenue]